MKQNVYIDSNVIISDFFYREGKLKSGAVNTKALKYFYSRKNIDLYISSFTVAQFISTLSNKKIPLSTIISEVRKLQSKFNIVNFTSADINNSIDNIIKLKMTNDLEDQFQFDLSKKVKCIYLITNNLKDFNRFANIIVIEPKKYVSIFPVN